jgi:hypothetical protein
MHTRPIRPHQMKKKQSAIANRSDTVAKALSATFEYGGQGALGKRFYHSNGVSVPAEKWIKHPHHGLFTNIPWNKLNFETSSNFKGVQTFLEKSDKFLKILSSHGILEYNFKLTHFVFKYWKFLYKW